MHDHLMDRPKDGYPGQFLGWSKQGICSWYALVANSIAPFHSMAAVGWLKGPLRVGPSHGMKIEPGP